MTEEEDAAAGTPFMVIGAEDTLIVFSNMQIVQHEEQEFILTFAQYSPPLILASGKEREERLKQMPYIPVKVVARIGITPPRMKRLIEALQKNYNTWTSKQEGRADGS